MRARTLVLMKLARLERNGPHRGNVGDRCGDRCETQNRLPRPAADFRKRLFYNEIQSGRPDSNRRRPAWEAWWR